ncbi:serine/threonine protein kinase, CMGC, dual-specificity [Ceratocystis pirilliformis]|uniref:dual-specificity kinase n=1 Tax=Ceratocystis pirilliformis TaxID=259994 RepID=A0ABR3Z2W0_9PEZI
MLSASSSNNHSLFSFGRNAASSAAPTFNSTPMKNNLDKHDVTASSPTFDFLPSVNFDDLQSSLEEASTEFKLSPFITSPSSASVSTAASAPANPSAATGSISHHSLSLPLSVSICSDVGSLISSSSHSTGNNPPVSMRTSSTTIGFNKMSETHPQIHGASASASNLASSSSTTRVIIPQSMTSTSRHDARTHQRSASLLHSQRNSSRPSTSPATSEMHQPPSRTTTGRQSHYPPVSNSNMPKPILPRKSIGPGIDAGSSMTSLSSSLGLGRRSSTRRPSIGSDVNPNRTFVSASTLGVGDGMRSSLDSDFISTNESTSSNLSLSTSRASKARSVHSFSKPTQASLANSNSTLTPDRKSRLSSFHLRSPRTSLKAGVTVPSTVPPAPAPAPAPASASLSSAKRVSVMPGMPSPNHVHGLGARTISPTDARRMKRLSMHNSSSNNSTTSISTPTPGLASDIPPPPPSERRTSSRSPSVPRKATATPSSSRTTPDTHRKSYGSGLSTGSAASVTTVRTSTGSIAPRVPQIPQSMSTSRLPAPKALTLQNIQMQSTANDLDEEVPPVPAIPKAYGSPKEPPAEYGLMDKKKLSMMLDTSSAHSLQSNSTGSGSALGLEVASGSTVGSKVSMRKGSYHSQTVRESEKMNQSRKNLKPLRLPPMHIGPLSTPTANKIASLPLNNNTSPSRLSPAPKQPTSKTPTTPMTASKTSFFSRNYDTAIETPVMRSSSSINSMRLHSPIASAVDSTTDSIRTSKLRDKSSSPYLSSSLPKSGASTVTPTGKGGHGRNVLVKHNRSVPKSRAEDGATTPTSSVVASSNIAVKHSNSINSSKPSGPRAIRMSTKGLKSPPPPSSPEDQEPPTPSSMSSLRRKLSLSWKRGASKSSITLPPGVIETTSNLHTAQRHDPAPPPRLPTSMTGKLSPTTSIKSGSTYLETRRRKSSISSLTTIGIGMQERHRGEWASHSGALKKPIMPETSDRLAPNNGLRKMKPRTSITPMNKSAATDLWVADMDKDDLLAEEDMRKLAMRRKETEVAARMLDQLRKRANPKERVSSQDAIRIARLNSYEHGEIMDYNDVYFCGTQNAQKVVGDIHGNAPNFGYDDERGDYAIIPGDHLAYRYEIIDILGKGSFGQVVRCIDHCLGVLVAIKIIRNKKRFHQQAIVEVNILKKLREWDPHNHHSMVNFTDKFYFRGHLCISTELLDMNLYEFIKVNNFRGFSLRLIRRFTKQILSSLNLLKHRRVIHCDLKPENILIRHPLHSEIKVIDFGSSCFENEKIYTYIQSRFYRSPEVILGMTYGLPIDMWSVGCILAELYTGVPIFPGENEQEQLACIMEVFGPPEKHLIEKSTRKKLFFDSMGKPRLTVSTKGRRRRPSSKTLQQVLKCDDEPFLDFIARCLRWDPDRRMRPEEAIRHEFITGQKPALRPPRDMSPMKRTNTIATSRPLPEPPASTFRRTREPSASGTSPSKSTTSGYVPVRRGSNAGYGGSSMLGTGGNAASGKRVSTGVASIAGNSNLPRVSNRSASGKLPDLASTNASMATMSSARR